MGGVISGTQQWTYEVYNADADGGRPKGPLFILCEDPTKNTWSANATGVSTPAYWYSAYADGDQCQVYTPFPGEEFNLLVADVAGTGDDHAVGEILIIDDGTGKLIATTGTPETECFMLLETLTDPATTDNLAWCIYTGY
jgi:hypothetical protein